MLTTLLLLSLSALAQDEAVPAEPVPIVGNPVPVLVTAYLVPPQDKAWLTDESRFRVCTLDIAWAADAPLVAQPLDCPEPMGAAVAKAMGKWEFKPTPPENTDLTHFKVTWVFRYEEKIGVTTLHAEVDPGAEAAFEGMMGPPGLKLVHPAQIDKEKRAKAPRKARRKNLDKDPCTGRVQLDAGGNPVRVEWTSCPDSLRASAGKALTKWHFSPRVVDGITDVDALDVEVRFK